MSLHSVYLNYPILVGGIPSYVSVERTMHVYLAYSFIHS